MKKAILLLAFPLAIIACGKVGPEADGEKKCNLVKDWKVAYDEGDIDKAQKIREDCTNFDNELAEKYKDDPKALETIAKIMEDCRNN